MPACLALLALMAIVMGALASFGQTDFKRLVAYSSINHMGFVVLGIAVAAYAAGSPIARIAGHRHYGHQWRCAANVCARA